MLFVLELFDLPSYSVKLFSAVGNEICVSQGFGLFHCSQLVSAS